MNYYVTIGLELHCELKSNSKVFSRGKNSYSELCNVNIVPLDMAFPGTLPVVNYECVKKAIKMALCLNCEIPEYLVFDRKNYYYPDLPKGYQITQSHYPIGINGEVIINVNGKDKNILIHDIHLEEDTASLDHYDKQTLINYNRSGVPLIEMVTEPCLHSAEEAVSFLEYLRNILKYTDISDADTKKGQIRCDVNVSLSKDKNKLGTKVEIKNVNSFSNVKDAIKCEIKRQKELFDQNRENEIVQETRRYDEVNGKTIHMRTKVESVDYKYFIEPNIPKTIIERSWIEEIKKEIPLLPEERRRLYIKEYDLSEYDANILIKDKDVSDYYQECVRKMIDPKIACNYIISIICGYLNKELLSINEITLTPDMLMKIYEKQKDNSISSKQAKELIIDALENNINPIEKLDNIKQMSNEEELDSVIKKVLDENQKQIADYHNGRTNLFDYFVGQVMKETRGKANPVKTKEILNKYLN